MKKKCGILLAGVVLIFSIAGCSNNLREKGNRYDEKKADDSIEQRTPTTTPTTPAGNAGQSTTDSGTGGSGSGDHRSSGTDTGGN